MPKSLVNYNYLAAKRLENIKAFKEYGFSSNTGELRKYRKTKKIPLSAGIYNFIKSSIYQLKP